MEIICEVRHEGRKIRIAFESGWVIWVKEGINPGFALEEGTLIDRREITDFILLNQYPDALHKAVSLLAASPRSKKEIADKLKHARYDEEVINLVVYMLEKEGLLDDHEFSLQWVQSRMRKYGNARIAQELRKKGIDRETIEGSLKACGEEEQFENAVSLASKKIRSLETDEDSDILFRRILGFLVRRGYSWENAKRATERAFEKIDSE